MVEDEAGKDKETKKSCSNEFSDLENKKTREVHWMLIGVILGSVLGFLFAQFTDWIKDYQTKEGLKEIICLDVQKTTSALEAFLEVTDLEDLIKKSNNNPEWSPNITDYDTSVWDTCIPKISLLSKHPVKVSLLFYEFLRNANGAKYLIQNRGSKMSSEERAAWIKILYNSIDNAAKLGKELITDDQKLNMTEREDSFYKPYTTGSSTSYM